jgi:hypothetical protein
MRQLWLLCALTLPALVTAQPVRGDPKDVILDALVFGVDIHGDTSELRDSLRAEFEQYRRKASAYHTKKRPLPSSDFAMLYAAWEDYERRLVAITSDPRATELAQDYVERLRPCYEWEGYHECPEKDAVFADRYLIEHPRSPFAEYLPLLAAHRWLCAAEAYQYEEKPAEIARSRRAYEKRLPVALVSKSMIVRAAAARLKERGSCLPKSIKVQKQL